MSEILTEAEKAASNASAAPKAVAFERAPEHDRRVSRGDGFAGDAWRNCETGVLRHVSVGHDPNKNEMFEIWLVDADGKRELVRDDVADRELARALVSQGNNGAAIRGEQHRYIAVPDLDEHSHHELADGVITNARTSSRAQD